MQGRVALLIAADGLQQGVHGAVQHGHAADGFNHVAALQPRGIGGPRGGHLADVGIHPRNLRHAANPEVQDGDHDGQNEVHPGAHYHGEHALPHTLPAVGAGVGGVLALRIVLAVEGAVAAYGNGPQGKLCVMLFALPAKELRAEADGELHHLNARQPGRQEMPRLVHHNQNAQQKQGHQHIKNCHRAPFVKQG